jgi:hypothetical protein
MENKNIPTKNSFSIISQILEEKKVGEKDDDNIIKYFSSTAIIFGLAEKLFSKNISEDDFLLSLKFLDTTDQNYKDILDKVKEKVFPLLELEKPDDSKKTKVEENEENIITPKIIKSRKKITNINDTYREPIE